MVDSLDSFERHNSLESKPDDAFRRWQPDWPLDVEGKVVVGDPPRKLAVTWRVMWIEEMWKLPKCLVTYEIDELRKVVRLTMTELHQIALDEKTLEGGRRGWPVILNNLKTLLETGQPMPEFDFMSDAKQSLEGMKEAARRHTGGGNGRWMMQSTTSQLSVARFLQRPALVLVPRPRNRPSISEGLERGGDDEQQVWEVWARMDHALLALRIKTKWQRKAQGQGS